MNAKNNRFATSVMTAAIRLALAMAFCAPWAAWAQEFELEEPETPSGDPERLAELTEVRNTVEFGLLYVDDDSFRFGRYNGLAREGGYGVLSLDWQRRNAFDSEDGRYCRIVANDLGLRTREVVLEYGDQGNFRIRAEYDQTPTFRSDSARTVFAGAGGALLTLPGDWVPAQNTAGMSRLLPSLGRVDIEHERRRTGAAVEKVFSERWALAARFDHEDKDGVKTIGGVIGNSGGNPRSAVLPEPIDYDTQAFDVALRFDDSRKQFEARYHASLFDNANAALVWQNPYSAINGWNAAAGYPGGQGQLALPPDNAFHQLSFQGGYNWDSRTRLSADLAFGRMTQDEAFLPYTINPTLAASITQPLPRDSLDGRIDTTVANLRFSSRPSDRWHWNALLRYDDRDNRTPRDEYVYIGGDSQTQDTSATSSRRRYNEPYSYREIKGRVDSGFRLGRGTDMSASLERRDIARTYSEREDATEDTFSLALSRNSSEFVTFGARASRSRRDGSTYVGAEPFLSGYSPGYTATVAGGWENPPGLRKYHLADRNRDQYALFATWTPSERWSIGADLELLDDDYDRSELGLTRSRIAVQTLDIAYVPSAAWSTYAFYARERLDFDQDGQSIRGATRIVDAVDPARAWTARHRDRVDSGGVGLNWKPEDRLEIGMDYVVSNSYGVIDVVVGSGLTAGPLPPNKTRLHTLELSGRYRLRRDLSLELKLWNERYRSSDFALDGIEANQLANVILLGEESPDYNVNAIAVSLAYRF